MSRAGSFLSIARRLVRVVGSVARTQAQERERSRGRAERRRLPLRTVPGAPRPGAGRYHDPADTASRDIRDRMVLSYSPSDDGQPDPGEIVWTRVAYEDDPSRGKDRPVLLIGRDGGALLGLMLTSRDRNNGDDHDRRYVDIGTGSWDRQGRPSEVKVDRLLRVAPGEIRREGAVLPLERFRTVIEAAPEQVLRQGEAHYRP